MFEELCLKRVKVTSGTILTHSSVHGFYNLVTMATGSQVAMVLAPSLAATQHS